MNRTMDEHTQAISFANSYFALVDGLASGFENHLAENVILDWFGRVIRGRKNVKAFMGSRKANSRHMFTRIVPTGSIDFENRQQECLEKCDNHPSDETFSQEIEISSSDQVVMDINQNEIDDKRIGATDDTFYYLSDDDLSNLFKLEISSPNVEEELGHRINRMKLKEEMAATIKAFERERGQEEDGPVNGQTAAVKYVEADGEIEFSRRKRDTWNAYCLAKSSLHTWRRPCKLRIAYSTLTECPTVDAVPKCEIVPPRFEQPKAKLPSLDEINEITNRLIPNANSFGGFLRELDFFKDRKHFLENLELEMVTNDPCTPPLLLQSVEDKLVFDKPCVNAYDGSERMKKRFVFNYQICLIVYEGNSKCKRNLLSKFKKINLEEQEMSDA